MAECAINHYDNVLHPTKGKPKEIEWTVYAAIVAEEKGDVAHSNTSKTADNRLWVVSCATGTKCSAFVSLKDASAADTESMETTILRDCHAEALARRGLLRVLWAEASHLVKNSVALPFDTKNGVLELDEGCKSATADSSQAPPQFRLRSNVALHMYVSDSLCGDASIYPLKKTSEICGTANDNTSSSSSPSTKKRNWGDMKFSGAKVIVSEKTGVEASACGGDHQLLSTSTQPTRIIEGGDPSVPTITPAITVAREETQLIGKLRTKSGRSNLPSHMRSSCMSCSDKVVRWNVLGLQGALLSQYIPSPLRLSSIIVSQDPQAFSKAAQKEALCRATQQRIVATLEHLQKLQSPHHNDNPLHSIRIENFLREWKGPSVHIVTQGFARGKATMDFSVISEQQNNSTPLEGEVNATSNVKKCKRTIAPCGVSINWDQTLPATRKESGDMPVEQIVGARGLCQGKKPKQVADYHKLASRLSRYTFGDLTRLIRYDYYYNTTGVGTAADSRARDSKLSYKDLKQVLSDTTLKELRSTIFSSGPLAGWLISP